MSLERGIELFNRREFFICHEVLEEIWTRERGPRRLFLQALIHFAVAFYHDQRGNPVGATRQLRKGLRKLAPYLPACEGIDTARLYGDGMAAVVVTEAGGKLERYPAMYGGAPGTALAGPSPARPRGDRRPPADAC